MHQLFANLLGQVEIPDVLKLPDPKTVAEHPQWLIWVFVIIIFAMIYLIMMGVKKMFSDRDALAQATMASLDRRDKEMGEALKEIKYISQDHLKVAEKIRDESTTQRVVLESIKSDMVTNNKSLERLESLQKDEFPKLDGIREDLHKHDSWVKDVLKPRPI